MTRAALFVAAVLAALIGLVGCAAPTTSPGTTIGPALTAPADAVQVSAPAAVRIPAVGASSTLVGLGLAPDGTLAVPPVTEPGQASWFNEGVQPGAVGPAVVAGHVSGPVDGVSVPGVFARLAELAPGDEVIVDLVDGTEQRWRVERVETYGKDTFPTELVYGDTDGPALRVITCGGTFDPVARSFEDNIVAYAVLADTT